MQVNPPQIWTFIESARIFYQPPSPPGATFRSGDVLTINAITRSQYAGGQIYAWNPYDSTAPSAYFPEAGRDAAAGISTFKIPLASWMTGGFHFKLMRFGAAGGTMWEPDASNRLWRPCDGSALWIKSGQCDRPQQPTNPDAGGAGSHAAGSVDFDAHTEPTRRG